MSRTLPAGDQSIVCACHLSEVTKRNMYENLIWALAYDVFGNSIAAGVLF
jgi:cation transport ATPase